MAKEKEFNYCQNCGAELPFDAKFCPDCGNVISAEKGSVDDAILQRRLSLVAVFTMIFAVLAIITGLSTIGMADQIIDILKQDPDTWAQILASFADSGYSEEEAVDLIKGSFLIVGGFLLISGVSAVIGAVCAFAKKYWVLGLIGMILATVFMLPTLLGLVIGILVVYFYVTCKPIFE